MNQSFVYQLPNTQKVYRDFTHAQMCSLMTHSSISIPVTQTIVTELANTHELIGDLLRNPATAYQLVAIGVDSTDRTHKRIVEPKMSLEQVLSWLCNHTLKLQNARYIYNRIKKDNKYVLECVEMDFDSEEPYCYHLIEI